VLVHGDRVFVTPAGKNGLMAALDKRSGATLWVTPPLADEHACYGSPILLATGGRQMVVNSGPQYAFAVDAKNGKLCWKVPQVDNCFRFPFRLFIGSLRNSSNKASRHHRVFVAYHQGTIHEFFPALAVRNLGLAADRF
jgi:outer membrane protein assembly factor BamB